MTKRIIPGYYPSKAAFKLHAAEPQMKRIEQASQIVDLMYDYNLKKADKYTKPI